MNVWMCWYEHWKLYIRCARAHDAMEWAKRVWGVDSVKCTATLQDNPDVELRFIGNDYHYPPDLHMEVRELTRKGWSEWRRA